MKEQAGGEQAKPAMPNEAFMLESSSRHGKRVKIDPLIEDISLDGMDCIIQLMKRRFEAIKLSQNVNLNVIQLSQNAMNVVIKDIEG